jgi:hypothetical protein
MTIRILPFFMLLQIVDATQASRALPEVVKFAPDPNPTPYVINTIADWKYCPLDKCLKCCQYTNVFNRPHCSRCREKA